MKLSDYKGEKALDVLADLIDPITAIVSDEETAKRIDEIRKGKHSIASLVKPLIKDHKKQVIEILAVLDDTPVEEYEISLFTLPLKLIEIINDPDLKSLFTSQDSMTDEKSLNPASTK